MPSLAIQSNDNEPLLRATFGAASINVTPAATPTVIWVMAGLAGKVIRIKNLNVYGIATGNGVMHCAVKRLSALPTAGTAVGVTAASHDTNDLLTPLPVIQHYTANPNAIAGITTGLIDGGPIGFSSGGQLNPFNKSLGWLNDKAMVLRGVLDVIAVDLLGGAVPAGGAFSVGVEFTVETAGGSFDTSAVI